MLRILRLRNLLLRNSTKKNTHELYIGNIFCKHVGYITATYKISEHQI